jgi:integrase
MKAPYEPLVSSSMEHVTMKTVFLLLLASGCRRNEIHALSVKNILFLEDNSVVLTPNPKFKAKNFNTRTGAGAFVGFKIESLINYVGLDLPDDASLCPVRCLKEYLKRTKSRRRGISDLFITISEKGLVKATHPNTLSSWVKGVIAKAYDTNKRNKGALLNRATHEIRAQGASYALYENVAMESILQQCRWSQQTTFTSFYLREVSGQLGEVHALAPLMSAGAIINGSKKRGGRS